MNIHYICAGIIGVSPDMIHDFHPVENPALVPCQEFKELIFNGGQIMRVLLRLAFLAWASISRSEMRMMWETVDRQTFA